MKCLKSNPFSEKKNSIYLQQVLTVKFHVVICTQQIHGVSTICPKTNQGSWLPPSTNVMESQHHWSQSTWKVCEIRICLINLSMSQIPKKTIICEGRPPSHFQNLDLICGIYSEGLAFGMCMWLEMTSGLFNLFGLTNNYAISCGYQCKTMVGRLRTAFLNVKTFVITRRPSFHEFDQIWGAPTLSQ